MPAKLTTNDFISRSIIVHCWTYEEYGEYVDAHTPVTIVCKEHGPFEQMPYVHLRGAGCPSCAKEMKRRSLASFTNKAKEVHGDQYSYELVEPGWVDGDVTIICTSCGEHIIVDAVYHMKGGPKRCNSCS